MTRKEYITALFRQYEPLRSLSRCGEDEVLLLRHRELQRLAVVRSYSSPVFAYQKLLAVRHPHLPEVWEVRTLTDGQVVLEEYVEGDCLADVLERGVLPYRVAKRVLCDIGAALVTLHRMGIVHRDIKPENVIVTRDGRSVLLDLNASRQFDSAKRKDTVVLGTIGYAPPEQFGISQSDVTADVYALGVLLNVMLTGCHPSERLASGRAAKIILRSTQISPDHRFRSAEDLLGAL